MDEWNGLCWWRYGGCFFLQLGGYLSLQLLTKRYVYIYTYIYIHIHIHIYVPINGSIFSFNCLWERILQLDLWEDILLIGEAVKMIFYGHGPQTWDILPHFQEHVIPKICFPSHIVFSFRWMSNKRESLKYSSLVLKNRNAVQSGSFPRLGWWAS